jgi:hypothetical protein
MESYNFLQDPTELEFFCNNILPQLEPDESYSLMLGARRKYLKGEEKHLYVMSGTDMLKRVVVRDNSFATVKRAVMDLCIPKGTYTDKNGKVLPDHCFTVYMTINPSSGKMATVNLIHKLTDLLANNDAYFKIDGHAKTMLHKSVGRRVFIDFDIDVMDKERRSLVMEKVCDELGESEFHSVMTRGGVHVILNKNFIDPKVKNTFYRNIQKINDDLPDDEEIECKPHTMLPVPGCFQGGHVPMVI